jgi:hypothetical protein
MELIISRLSDDRLCGLVVRVSGYRSRGPGFEAVGLERGPLSLASTHEYN